MCFVFFFSLVRRSVRFPPHRRVIGRRRVSGGIHYEWLAVRPTSAVPQGANVDIRPPVTRLRNSGLGSALHGVGCCDLCVPRSGGRDRSPLLLLSLTAAVRNGQVARADHLFHDAAQFYITKVPRLGFTCASPSGVVIFVTTHQGTRGKI